MAIHFYQDRFKIQKRTTGIVQHKFTYGEKHISRPCTIKIIDVGGSQSSRKTWIHCFGHVSSVVYISALNHYCEVLWEDDTKNAMWESLELFHTISDGKWFRWKPIVVLLNKPDLFRECVLQGYQLRDCFDGGASFKHSNSKYPLGEPWPGAFDQICKYDDIEWNPAAQFVPTDGYTAEEIATTYFEDVINTQMNFIMDIFFHVAEHDNRRKKDKSVHIHVITAVDTESVHQASYSVFHNSLNSSNGLNCL